MSSKKKVIKCKRCGKVITGDPRHICDIPKSTSAKTNDVVDLITGKYGYRLIRGFNEIKEGRYE